MTQAVPDNAKDYYRFVSVHAEEVRKALKQLNMAVAEAKEEGIVVNVTRSEAANSDKRPYKAVCTFETYDMEVGG